MFKITKRLLELKAAFSKYPKTIIDNNTYEIYTNLHSTVTIKLKPKQILIYLPINVINITLDYDISEILNNKYNNFEYVKILLGLLQYTIDCYNPQINMDTDLKRLLNVTDDNQYCSLNIIHYNGCYNRYIPESDIINDDIVFLYGQEHLVPHTIIVSVYNYISKIQDDELQKYYNESLAILKQRIIDEKPTIYNTTVPIDIDCHIYNLTNQFEWSNNNDT